MEIILLTKRKQEACVTVRMRDSQKAWIGLCVATLCLLGAPTYSPLQSSVHFALFCGEFIQFTASNYAYSAYIIVRVLDRNQVLLAVFVLLSHRRVVAVNCGQQMRTVS